MSSLESDEDSDLIIACTAYFLVKQNIESKKTKSKTRRWWQRSLFQNRLRYGGIPLLRDLQMEDQSLFRNFSRMSVADFEKLLVLVEPIISKQDTNYRKCISSRERLALTLRFLATGDSYTMFSYASFFRCLFL